MAVPKKIAVVGSGMAGLVTAYLLKRDGRFQVEIFEKPSLDSASVDVPNGTGTERIDMPMRSFAGGYYPNLKALYDFLQIPYHSQNFLFEFSTLLQWSHSHATASPSFIYASNLHRLPPKPEGLQLIPFLWTIIYLAASYAWFIFCCFAISPLEEDETCESLGHYLQRAHVPQTFVNDYLLPIISSVATCSHDDLLAFPAKDIVDYKRKSHAEKHFTVVNGVHSVQTKLLKGLSVRTCQPVTSVKPLNDGVRLLVQASGKTTAYDFDAVVLAVEPPAVATLFSTIAPIMNDIPTTFVESVVHKQGRTRNDRDAQTIRLTSKNSRTESRHEQPSGVLVTTSPREPINPNDVIKIARFVRTLRTPESRRAINALLEPSLEEKKIWSNGDQGVWLAGAWAWDGMVLLEGCVVSAMRVASGLGVEIPWKQI